MGRKSTTPELFIIATGQDDNVGDVVLRREYLDRLRPLGPLHLFLGSSSDDFVGALQLDPRDVIYRGFRTWYFSAVRASARRRVWLVDKPGELQLDRGTLRRKRQLAPLSTIARWSGGQSLRLGVGVRAGAKSAQRFHALLHKASITRWRDTLSPRVLGFGETAPDWAFAWSKTDDRTLTSERRDIILSFRGDREALSEKTLAAIRATADQLGLRIRVLTQVRRDARRSAELASSLGAELIDWPHGAGLAEHETAIREAYREAALVISDRLHALIIGMTEGAVPLCITEQPENKVDRHLDVAGFPGSAVVIDDDTSVGDLITNQVCRRPQLIKAISRSRDDLEKLVDLLTRRAQTTKV